MFNNFFLIPCNLPLTIIYASKEINNKIQEKEQEGQEFQSEFLYGKKLSVGSVAEIETYFCGNDYYVFQDYENMQNIPDNHKNRVWEEMLSYLVENIFSELGSHQ